jgi:hydroxymethylbilane synthase
MFTKEIEEALLANKIDLAVHSLKDLPTELAAPFTIAAIPPRIDPRDAFVSVKYASFASLPSGARIGTSSLRRQSQLLAQRRDVELVEFRGNVDTRLRKLSEGVVDAVILASAGLERLERTEWIRERFSSLVLCPAPGQGALAIETRADDPETLAAVAFLDDVPSRFAVTAERAALAELGGGCHVPIGVYCEPSPAGYIVTGVVAHPDGSALVRAELDHQREQSAEELGQKLAHRLMEQGAREILGAVQL